MKKLTILFIAIMVSFVLSSCDKSTNDVLANLGTIQCTNISSDPYFVSITGPTTKTITVQSKGVQSVSVKAGSYTIDVTQQSGYLIYPTKQSFEGTVLSGKTLVVAFPQ